MYIYLITFWVSILVVIVFGNKRKNIMEYNYEKNALQHISGTFRISKKRFGVFLAALPPIFISAVRYDVGTDFFATYYSGFYRVLNGSNNDKFEIGYKLVIKVIQIFTSDAQWIFVLTSIIFIGCSFKIFADQSVDIPFSILLFLISRFYLMGMNVIRQMIAIAIFTYALKYVLNKNLKKYILFSLLAISFHYSAILLLPIYYIGRLKINRRRFIQIGMIEILFASLAVSLVYQLLKVVSLKYYWLLYRFEVCGLNFTIFTIVFNVLLLFIYFYNYKSYQNNERYCLYLNIQIMATLISFVLRSIPLLERVYWLYSFPILVSIPYMLKTFEKKWLRYLATMIIIVFMVFYFIYDIIILNDHSTLPYIWKFST